MVRYHFTPRLTKGEAIDLLVQIQNELRKQIAEH